MNVKKCTVCNINIDDDNCKKDRNICKNCYNINRKKYNKIVLPEKQKHNITPNISTYENHRHVVIGPSNVGKTYYMLKILEKIGNKRPIHIITRSPNQNIRIIKQVMKLNQ